MFELYSYRWIDFAPHLAENFHKSNSIAFHFFCFFDSSERRFEAFGNLSKRKKIIWFDSAVVARRCRQQLFLSNSNSHCLYPLENSRETSSAAATWWGGKTALSEIVSRKIDPIPLYFDDGNFNISNSSTRISSGCEQKRREHCQINNIVKRDIAIKSSTHNVRCHAQNRCCPVHPTQRSRALNWPSKVNSNKENKYLAIRSFDFQWCGQRSSSCWVYDGSQRALYCRFHAASWRSVNL